MVIRRIPAYHVDYTTGGMDGWMCRQLLRALTVNKGLFKGNTLTCTHSASACHANTATYLTSSNYGESSAASFFVVVKVYFLFYRGTYICRGRRNLLVIVVCRRPLMSPRNGGITRKNHPLQTALRTDLQSTRSHARFHRTPVKLLHVES